MTNTKKALMNNLVIMLTLTMLWLGSTVVIFSREWTRGPLWRPISGISMGWLTLVIAAYNFVRAWGIWSDMKRQRQQEDELGRRPRKPRPVPQEPDPNFQFNNPPATAIPEADGDQK